MIQPSQLVKLLLALSLMTLTGCETTIPTVGDPRPELPTIEPEKLAGCGTSLKRISFLTLPVAEQKEERLKALLPLIDSGLKCPDQSCRNQIYDRIRDRLGDTTQTIQEIKLHNAAFKALCPDRATPDSPP